MNEVVKKVKLGIFSNINNLRRHKYLLAFCHFELLISMNGSLFYYYYDISLTVETNRVTIIDEI
jgi:hypothetical protein